MIILILVHIYFSPFLVCLPFIQFIQTVPHIVKSVSQLSLRIILYPSVTTLKPLTGLYVVAEQWILTHIFSVMLIVSLHFEQITPSGISARTSLHAGYSLHLFYSFFVELALFSWALRCLHSHTHSSDTYYIHMRWHTVTHEILSYYNYSSADALIQEYFLSYAFLQRRSLLLLAAWCSHRYIV